MKRIFSEKILVLALFGIAFLLFYVANEDAKKLGVLQKTGSAPSLFMSNQPTTSLPGQSTGNANR